MENSHRSHPQLYRRSTLVTKLPRQPDMDDRSASPPKEPRKTPDSDGSNRVSTVTSNKMTTPFGDHATTTTTSPCLSPVEYRAESPPAPLTTTAMTLFPTNEERRTSPPPPAAPPSAHAQDPSEDDSIALARMLMAQEAMESYALSADYLRYNSAQYSQEDLEALQAALDDEDDEELDDDELDDDGGETNDMEYEMMLRLGEAIGDVKQERWKMKADQHIAKLPTFAFAANDVAHLDENDSRCKCLVCQFSYEEGESLRKLPCGHCFHTECVDQWLKEKDCCAYCRQPIVKQE